MSSFETQNHKKTYDDISLEKRQKLIYLINQQQWTIPSAAKELGIKLCTAKYILYLFRKKGRIYRKKAEIPSKLSSSEKQQDKVVYIPYPVYVLCCCFPQQAIINSIRSHGNVIF